MNSPQKILIADSQSSFTEPLCMVLQDEGFECSATTGWQNLLLKLAGERPDFLILSVDLVKSVRELSTAVNPPGGPVGVVLLAHYDDLDRLYELRKSGMNTFFIKPVDFDELLYAIKQLAGNGER